MRPIRDLPALLTTPLGRRAVAGAMVPRLAPVIHLAAATRRRLDLRRAPVVAVVGSYGKTTTCRAIRAALGLPTEPPPGNGAAFASLRLLTRRPGSSPLVLEAGVERPRQMAAAASTLRPDVVVVTSIGSEHHRSFGTLEATRREKVEMVRAQRPGGTTILNGDDPHVLWMRDSAPGHVVTFGFDESCDLRADPPSLDWPEGMTFGLTRGRQLQEVRVRLVGRQMVYPVLAAVAVAACVGAPLPAALERLTRLPPTPGRLQPVPTRTGAVVLRDDFKSSWETMIAALELLAELPARRRIVVFGGITEPPSPQRQHYRELGQRVAAIADRLIVVGQQFRAYRSGAREGGLDDARILDAGSSLDKALKLLPDDLGPGDVVLLKGRRTQRLERLSLRLCERTVGCRLTSCTAVMTECATCPMLESGWGNRRVVM